MISPLAHIHPDAKIGNNVTIEPFAVIHQNVTIGDDNHIMSNVVICPGTTIGKSNKIFPGAVIGAIPQDLKFVGEETTVEIGDFNTIRECVTVNRGTKDRWRTVLGNHNLLMAYAHVAHDCTIGNSAILANGVQLAGHVTVDDYAILGGLAGVHQFTRIGAHTYTAGHIVIRKDVPPYVKAARDPLSYMGVNVVGLQRRNIPKETITQISDIYHILFVEKHTTAEAIAIVERNFDSSPIKEEILQFISTSRTGIIRRQQTKGDENLSI